MNAVDLRCEHLENPLGTDAVRPRLSWRLAFGSPIRMEVQSSYQILVASSRKILAEWVWERWDSWTKEHGFKNSMMNSFCHYAFGSVSEWMFNTVLGISPAKLGYARVRIAPRPGGGLTWAKGHYDSVRGRISVDWSIEDDGFHLKTVIPANTDAEILMPGHRATIATVGSGEHEYFKKDYGAITGALAATS